MNFASNLCNKLININDKKILIMSYFNYPQILPLNFMDI
jgi:hypothetical protein